MDVRVRLLSFAYPLILCALCVGASVLASTAVASRAYVQRAVTAGRQNQSISVKGSVRERLRSDRAVWNIRVSGAAAELQAAYAILENSVEHVQEFLKSQEFRREEISIGAIDTTPHYETNERGMSTRRIAEYELSRSFTITTPEVERVARSAGEVTALIKDGVKVMSFSPEFYYTAIGDLKVKLLGKATEDARARAEAIASAAGARIGEVRDAQMGVLQITRPLSTETSSYGVYDTSTIEKDVTAVVTLSVGIER